ncbi:unnamed protein product [marine sediment metagenome]|uniref:Uncharacterized protein n=1 Tax=marine sediment metagenome TaxID=412755 RepID=X1FR41_9ZZZZ
MTGVTTDWETGRWDLDVSVHGVPKEELEKIAKEYGLPIRILEKTGSRSTTKDIGNVRVVFFSRDDGK